METIGILGAMPQEINGIALRIQNAQEYIIGQRTDISGTLNNTPVVVVFSRWGKVAAATTVTTLIQHFKVTQVVFTGVAGGMAPHLRIGDFVIGQHFYQHDMDARPLMSQFEIPLLGTTFFSANAALIQKAVQSAYRIARAETPSPTVHVGNIASGDQFIASETQRSFIIQNLPHVIAVEMEGAAVAQVCHEFEIPFVVMRIISDTANQEAPENFEEFIELHASRLSALFIQDFI
jgi:adenosylhomocysteine nucleosidase